MVIKSRNNWGNAGGIEAQRGDLWVLDLETVLSDVRRAFGDQLELPQPSETIQFARQISFPEARISDMEVKALNTPKLYPGFDEAVGGVRVDFIVDSATTTYGSSVTVSNRLKRSKIHSLLYGWRVLTRVGRLPYNSEDLSVLLPVTPRPLGPIFKKDIKLYFLQGTTKDFADVDSNSIRGSALEGLDVSMAFVMKKCWISSIQLNSVDQSSTAPLTLTAVIVPEEIHPFDPTGLSMGGTIDGNIALRSSAFIRNPGTV